MDVVEGIDGVRHGVRRKRHRTEMAVSTLPVGFLVSDFTDCDVIEGGTLRRLKQTDTPGVYWVRRLAPTDVESGCDGCVQRHLKNNLRCSKTLGQKSPCHLLGHWYDFSTKKYIGPAPRLTQCERPKGSRISKETYQSH